jgi:hypothetical protein
MTLALTLIFVAPGAIYEIWRRTSRRSLCPACARDALIPVDTPVALALLESTRPYRHRSGAPTPAPDVRLERIEQAIDAIAVEVERVGEAQRYSARLLAERGTPRAAGEPRDKRTATPT